MQRSIEPDRIVRKTFAASLMNRRREMRQGGFEPPSPPGYGGIPSGLGTLPLPVDIQYVRSAA